MNLGELFNQPLSRCPRCTRLSPQAVCPACDADLVLEAEWGIAIGPDLWPIEGAADHARAVEAGL